MIADGERSSNSTLDSLPGSAKNVSFVKTHDGAYPSQAGPTAPRLSRPRVNSARLLPSESMIQMAGDSPIPERQKMIFLPSREVAL